ncbi:MAG: hypothetical protein ABDH37_08495 [Candidatus Hydrothermales bacterium]
MLDKWLIENKLDILTSLHFNKDLDVGWLFFSYIFKRHQERTNYQVSIEVPSLIQKHVSRSLYKFHEIATLNDERWKCLALLFHLMAFDEHFMSEEPIHLLIVSQKTKIMEEPGAVTVTLKLADPNVIIESLADKIIETVLPIITKRLQGVVSHVLFLEKALHSAVAAIMARNFSHLWGSNLLEVAKSEVDEYINLLSLLLSEKNKIIKELENDLIKSKDEFEKLKNVLSYIAGRSELIANTTAYLPINWGEGFLQQTLRNHNLKEGVLRDVDWSSARKLLEKLGRNQIKEFIIDEKLENISFGFPYGRYVGRHALYIILEDYIRNIQKHGYINESPLKVYLQLGEDKEGYVVVKLTSNSKIASSSEEYENKANFLQNIMNQPFINPDSSPNEVGWGFKEMMICAFLLAGLPIEKLDEMDLRNKVFSFLYDEAKKDGFYSFQFILRKMKLIREFKNKDDISSYITSEEIKPLLKSVLIHPDLFDLYAENWHIFPLMIGIKKGNKNMPQNLNKKDYFKKWLKKRIVEVEEIKYEEVLYKVVEKLGLNKETIWIKDARREIDKKIPCNNQGYNWGLYHQKSDKDQMEKKCQNYFGFSGYGAMLGIIRKIINNEPGIEEELKLILGSKILIIDDRIYKKVKEKEEREKKEREEEKEEEKEKEGYLKELEKIGIYVFPESGTEINIESNDDLRIQNINIYKNKELYLKNFHFMSIHLTYLKNKYDTYKKEFPLFKVENLEKCPTYIFVHTGRGGASEVISEYPWFQKVISYHNISSAFSTDYVFNTKILLIESFYF